MRELGGSTDCKLAWVEGAVRACVGEVGNEPKPKIEQCTPGKGDEGREGQSGSKMRKQGEPACGRNGGVKAMHAPHKQGGLQGIVLCNAPQRRTGAGVAR